MVKGRLLWVTAAEIHALFERAINADTLSEALGELDETPVPLYPCL
jgi:hypothetical protein